MAMGDIFLAITDEHHDVDAEVPDQAPSASGKSKRSTPTSGKS